MKPLIKPSSIGGQINFRDTKIKRLELLTADLKLRLDALTVLVRTDMDSRANEPAKRPTLKLPKDAA